MDACHQSDSYLFGDVGRFFFVLLTLLIDLLLEAAMVHGPPVQSGPETICLHFVAIIDKIIV